MINSAIQYGSQLAIYEGSQQVGNITIGNGIFLGHSSRFVVVQYDARITVFDQRGNQLGAITLPSDHRVQSITDNGFVARAGSRLIFYDEACNQYDSTSI